ncbi:MAG: hypothetical protein JEZ07_20055 [Phycisphaerae bacterium]|nr:hypothetical protein [Phycisphaerae bacterium]
MNQEYLEILIGKYIDGEITPAEELMLQDELHSNEASKNLFEQYIRFSQTAQQFVQAEVLDSGKDFNDIFNDAWQQSDHGSHIRFSWPSAKFIGGLASGLAAGFMLALIVLTGQPSQPRPTNHIPGGEISNAAVTPTIPIINTQNNAIDAREIPKPRQTVDYYYYTDDNGKQYIIENYRNSNVTNASYDGGL